MVDIDVHVRVSINEMVERLNRMPRRVIALLIRRGREALGMRCTMCNRKIGDVFRMGARMLHFDEIQIENALIGLGAVYEAFMYPVCPMCFGSMVRKDPMLPRKIVREIEELYGV